ncbi:MAG TPA: GYDIA family GHMP kinase [Prolixibacteraceae bacterium]|nr:GYDIA family GHMP kinase [Prolixibacteraceae bacterium]
MNKQPAYYHANGKLLLSGEYFVLHGAKALALPLKRGQWLRVHEVKDSKVLQWKAIYEEKIWFECELSPVDFTVVKSSDPEKASTLSLLMNTIRDMNPDFHPGAGTRFETTLDADPEWGFGSSSTLLSVLSQYAEVDAFQHKERMFHGSGFDIACATADGPILFTKDQPVQPVKLHYPFAKQLLLVYSGQKRNTFPEVSAFLQNDKPPAKLIDEISDLSDQFTACRDQQTFNQLIRDHETLVGNLLGQTPVKKRLFDDFEGEVKSLGAWGGDYYLVSCTGPVKASMKYFENKGLNIIFKWPELIKS